MHYLTFLQDLEQLVMAVTQDTQVCVGGVLRVSSTSSIVCVC